MVRFDNVPPGTVYAAAVFLDDEQRPPQGVQPGWWLGGYDFTGGIIAAPLKPISVAAGQGTAVAMDLRAVRGAIVNVKSSVQPLGNGQGPVELVVIDRPLIGNDAGDLIFGFGGTQCAKPLADGGADMFALFVGSGPYWLFADLDDFNSPGKFKFAPGEMITVEFDGGNIYVPGANEFDAGNAYVIAKDVVLDFVVPGNPGVDKVTCP
jgi:hypothetical protein